MSEFLIAVRKTVAILVKQPSTWCFFAFIFLILMPEQVFCAIKADDLKGLEDSASDVRDLIFSKPVRILVLTFSAASGAIISFLSGKGLAPLLSGLSLGIFLYFIPKILVLIEKVGSTFIPAAT